MSAQAPDGGGRARRPLPAAVVVAGLVLGAMACERSDRGAAAVDAGTPVVVPDAAAAGERPEDGGAAPDTFDAAEVDRGDHGDASAGDADANAGDGDARAGDDDARAPDGDASAGDADASAGDDDARAPDGDASAGDAADASFGCDGPGARFATRVVDQAFGPGQDFGRASLPGIVLGPPKGGGSAQGSTDVASLGVGGSITLAFDGNVIVDGPGPDFIVFENPFAVGGNLDAPFVELGTVAVSDDGVTWTSFSCTATSPPYGTCAGWHYVYANPDTNGIDPTDPTVAGGDPFDLADVGLARASFVRITSRPDLSTVFDLDAVSIVHGGCD
jgi:hypothetical protein